MRPTIIGRGARYPLLDAMGDVRKPRVGRIPRARGASTDGRTVGAGYTAGPVAAQGDTSPQIEEGPHSMARGVNKVILVGNLGNDPEIKYTQGGLAVCMLSLSTSSVRKDKEGQKM